MLLFAKQKPVLLDGCVPLVPSEGQLFSCLSEGEGGYNGGYGLSKKGGYELLKKEGASYLKREYELLQKDIASY